MYTGTGKRKSSIARVILKPVKNKKDSKIVINGREIDDYFPYKTLIQESRMGLVITNTENDFLITANIKGGGFSGQAGALKHGIVKALLEASNDYKKPLKEKGLVTRDARIKERKKYGLKAARRAPQFSKR
ncbi:MAG: 30S ribosomal protein S9 [Candidatus Hepatoplasma vulgare]|nr:MAG: 30S ribosomal protein S9 [Candidatus Hepatoplasma sp.]